MNPFFRHKSIGVKLLKANRHCLGNKHDKGDKLNMSDLAYSHIGISIPGEQASPKLKLWGGGGGGGCEVFFPPP